VNSIRQVILHSSLVVTHGLRFLVVNIRWIHVAIVMVEPVHAIVEFDDYVCRAC